MKRQGDAKAMEGISSIFLDPNEKAEAVLGEKYLHEFLEYGISRRGFCVVTDRHLYCRGKCYHKSGGAYTADTCGLVIDIRDIVCTGMCMGRLTGLLLAEMTFAAVWLLLIVSGMAMAKFVWGMGFGLQDMALVGSVFLISALIVGTLYYHRKRAEMFVIRYAGGETAVLSSEYSSVETEAFQRKIHEVKNKICA